MENKLKTKFCTICHNVYNDNRKKVCTKCGYKPLKNVIQSYSRWDEKENCWILIFKGEVGKK